MKVETSDTVRDRLNGYKMHSRDNALQYINNFLTVYRELNKIPGKSLSDSHTLSLFLKGIKDTDYKMFVEIQRNKTEEGLMNAIVVLRKKEQAIVQKRKEHRIACNWLRRLREEMEEEDDLDGESCPIKIRRVKDTIYDYIDTIRIVK
eukprot:6160144-Ditylum_brightwellii.AAC.1